MRKDLERLTKKVLAETKRVEDSIKENVNAIKNNISDYSLLAITDNGDSHAESTDAAVVDDMKWHMGKFTNSGTYKQDNYSYHTKLSCNAGDTFKFYTSIYGDGYYGALFFNSNNSLINKYLQGDSGAFHNYEGAEVTAPAGSSYVILQTLSGDYFKTRKAYKKVIMDVPTAIADITNKVNNNLKANILDRTEVKNGMYVFNFKFISDARGKSVYFTDIEEGDKIIVTTDLAGASGGYYPLQVLKEDGSNKTYGTQGGSLTDYEYTVQSDVVAIAVNGFEAPIVKRDVYLKKEVEYLAQNIGGTSTSQSMSNAKLCIGSTLYAIVGDTLQVFYDSIVESTTKDYVLSINCPKGKNFPRYYEYTPVASDVGTATMTITLYTLNGDIIDTKTVTLITKEAANPSSKVNVLCVGDSTMQQGQIPIEASRRCKGTKGSVTSPTSLSLSNINFVGRLKNSDSTVGWEGTGGWTQHTYIQAGGNAGIRWTVSGATNLNIGDVYDMVYDGSSYYRFQISEINVTSGSGNIFAIFYTTPNTDDLADSRIPATGTLTKVSGNGQDSITYTARSVEQYHPFWNKATNKFDLTTYANNYCGGKIDFVEILLGINAFIGRDAFTAEYTDVMEWTKTLCSNIHSEFPNAKVVLSTLPQVSVNGGIGSNYGAGNASGMYDADGFNHKVFEWNRKLFDLEKDSAYNSYVYVVNAHAQFDAEHGYLTDTKAVNTRSSITETIQINGVHPSNECGYLQLSDAIAFRPVLCLI